MSKTRHIHKRMSQRAVTEQMLDLVKQYGEIEGDKTVLCRKNIDMLLKEVQRLGKQLQKVRGKGGLVLVESGGVEITTYALDSYDRKKNQVH